VRRPKRLFLVNSLDADLVNVHASLPAAGSDAVIASVMKPALDSSLPHTDRRRVVAGSAA
jgi:hypothetical protein